jgi:riboflavin transporter FmnP
MNTKNLTLIIVFIALTTALNIAGPKIPAPYAPFLIYQLWEIPIVVAFLAIGVKAGLITVVVNSLILLATFWGALLLGPIYNLIAVLAMLLGIYIPYKIATHGCKVENLGNFLRQHIKMISIAATALGIIFRVVVMSAVNYLALQQPPPVGFALNSGEAIAYLPVVAIFNSTVTLYTVPIGIGIAVVIASRFKLQ